MEIIKITQKNKEDVVKRAVKILKEGGLVVYPTETVYGIGADATNQDAVDKLLKYKTRHEGKPLSVAVSDKQMATQYAQLNDVADNIYNNHLPGPITVISKGLDKVAEDVQSEYGTIGIRIPDYEIVLEIVKKLGRPITSTSANVTYKPRPYSIPSLKKYLSLKKQMMIDLAIDAGELSKNNQPSTVVDTTLNNANVMREGSVRFAKDISDDKQVMSAITDTAEETINFGSMMMLKYFDGLNDQPLVIALKGELGAGKTQFSKGIARTLKIKEMISSPTFTIIDEYEYESGGEEGRFLHADTWRIASAQEFNRTGLDKYMIKNNVIAIEWADKFYPELLELVKEKKARLVKVSFEYLSLDKRDIKIYEEV